MKQKVIIIGGGPIGLYIASKLDDYLLIEANDFLGGQLINLYPKKLIEDIENHQPIVAEDYIKELTSKINKNNINLNEKVLNIIPGKINIVKTDKNEYQAEKIIIATGLGFTTPRTLGIADEQNCQNVLYSLKDFSFLKAKKVAIFGGGDSALDWAKEISKISDNVSLIHRRTEFRGNPDTIKDCHNLKLYLPYVPFSLEKKNNVCTKITIKEVNENQDNFVTLDVDYILVNYGNIAKLIELPFERDGSFLKVNKNYEVVPNIFSVGDTCSYENKKRRITPGIKEADTVLNFIKQRSF